MKLVLITEEDTGLLEKFISAAGNSLERFRYFSKQGVDVMKRHLFTVMIIDNDENPVAYGHLDFESGTVWLGNCVIESQTGKGYGKRITKALLNYARDYNIETIKLSVDNVNEVAIKLYESFGFREIEKKDTYTIYEWSLKLNPEIYISTLAFTGKSAEEIIAVAENNNYNIEFSSGMPYRQDLERVFLGATIKKYAHNYFPAPEKPFVLNLASRSEEIRKASVEHCINGMALSEAAGARFFSAHAGFCIDPPAETLGNVLPKVKHIERKVNWKFFRDSIKEILQRTQQMNVRFLLENNGITKVNMYEDGTNPFLCCDVDEITKIIHDTEDPRLGILLDTAHLKISANTLKFDADAAVKKIKDLVRCVHHSDNDGETDSNMPLQNDYWFLKHMNQFPHAVHVIEVKNITPTEIEKEIKLLRESIVTA
jgi:sugar phosphate isomerase/epimerase/GNAT superfamily N-acetyltransferase